MSSREIAELTGKDHKNVLADMRKMLQDLGIQPAEFSAGYKDAKGEVRAEYQFPKRETLILVSGYNVQMRAKIIDRWQELEAQKSPLEAGYWERAKFYAAFFSLAGLVPLGCVVRCVSTTPVTMAFISDSAKRLSASRIKG